MEMTRKRIIFILFAITAMLFAVWLGIVLSGHCPSCILRP